jgi:GrpB-like predicted nucleotidyltransferase (UPF0157 family)
VSDSSQEFDAYLDEILIGDREPVEIVVSEYDPSWPARFETERQRLVSALGDTAVRIEHIGSTALPGLAAKPIIDVLVTVNTVELVDERYRPNLEASGYLLRVSEPDRKMFQTPTRDVHVHIWPASHEADRAISDPPDWLRYNESDRHLYEQRKRELAGQWPDMNHYAEAKSDVIVPILERAAWAKRQRLGPWAALNS